MNEMGMSRDTSNAHNQSVGYASKSRFLVCIAALLMIIFALISYVIFMQVREDEKNTSNIIRYVETKSEVLRFYGDFFKTPREQQQIEIHFFGDPNTVVTAPIKKDTNPRYFWHVCERETTPDEGGRPKLVPEVPTRPEVTRLTRPPFGPEMLGNSTVTRQSTPSHNNEQRFGNKRRRSVSSDRYRRQYFYHGCCKSYREFDSPSHAVSDQSNQRVELVQYGNESKQYFLVDICWHNAGCGLKCGCQQQIGLFKALIHNPEYSPGRSDSSTVPPYLVHKIRLESSCKCMNNMSPTVKEF